MIDKTFLITGLGRSGTSFLARLMNRSASYKVVHEWHSVFPGYNDLRLKRFPLHRFYLARHPFGKLRQGYGEVNSYLRFFIHADQVGSEQAIPKKGIIVRDARDVISSIMNRGGRDIEQFPEVCDRVLRMHWNLQAILGKQAKNYRQIDFEKLVSDRDYVDSILLWAGINDVHIDENDLKQKVNVNKTSWFPSWREWEVPQMDLYTQLDERYGNGEPPDMPPLK